MDDKLSAKREQLVTFLEAVQKVNDTFIFDISDSGKASVVAATADETCFFYGQTEFESSPNIILNVPDARKLVRAVKFIPDDIVTLKLTSNALKYSSKLTKFTYHLYDDQFLKRPKFRIDKFAAFTFDIEVDLKKTQIMQLVKNSSFVDGASKLYLYTEDGDLKGEITDKARANTDSIGLTIVEGVGVYLQPIILKLDNIQLLHLVEDDVKLKINTEKGILTFEIEQGANKFCYILTSLRQ